MQAIDQFYKTASEDLSQDKDWIRFVFLSEIFGRNRNLSRSYHSMHLELIIKYDPSKLMNFLQLSDSYKDFDALEQCKTAKLYKEQAFLFIKIGKTEEAVQILIDHCCDNLKEVVDLAVQFNISDDLLWEKIIEKS